MTKLSIIILMAVAVCSCFGVPDRQTARSVSEDAIVSNANQFSFDTVEAKDLNTAKPIDEFTARGKNNNKGNKNKMEALHMGLNYIKMIISTLMAAVGHLIAFKGVGLALISVIIQIAQFIMVLKKNKESHPPAYKVIETPWHTVAPSENYSGGGGAGYGSYNSYTGHGKSADDVTKTSPYASYAARRRR
ncbi:Hypothetical protein CINCED_3A014090 [Cinara cedri]|uniref:Uncharacterized protein n=1 Tax=Cinara cedri TaxID=506608 RepID=A0A5E4MC71_9HEMI|nr:Hypothetical protein CINCED_3A014090 [Cinara cedri]